MSSGETISLNLNGEVREAKAGLTTTLLEVIRDQLGLTGAKKGCNQGVCGACTVSIDGKLARACLSLAVNSVGREITTNEGLTEDGEPSALQQSFIDNGAVQCGFCTSGMIVSSHALLQDIPNPSIDEVRDGLSGNVCRCSGYRKIIDAVRGMARG
ncbi:MAG: (2Fe-2S)-binding protein [Rhodospirillales bacterium]|nr:(2Fe-2S)-binding protein [Rhodospirillales bacterium]MDP7100415.1 (2Fe-2S)-binding protein [Rhodospirillales bacterium]MDP7600135.1 (2Fe-2S)-binding protein [Rhodospirillales bacterium]MDP7623820.1 (2Fe-2S)-binding protein [Rhodospirillales bacterium]HJO85563.1 (2Fe-2S)-binding protein [Rhodospirillales bacterium]